MRNKIFLQQQILWEHHANFYGNITFIHHKFISDVSSRDGFFAIMTINTDLIRLARRDYFSQGYEYKEIMHFDV